VRAGELLRVSADVPDGVPELAVGTAVGVATIEERPFAPVRGDDVDFIPLPER
jgi:hypothetical protein